MSNKLSFRGGVEGAADVNLLPGEFIIALCDIPDIVILFVKKALG